MALALTILAACHGRTGINDRKSLKAATHCWSVVLSPHHLDTVPEGHGDLQHNPSPCPKDSRLKKEWHAAEGLWPHPSSIPTLCGLDGSYHLGPSSQDHTPSWQSCEWNRDVVPVLLAFYCCDKHGEQRVCFIIQLTVPDRESQFLEAETEVEAMEECSLLA